MNLHIQLRSINKTVYDRADRTLKMIKDLRDCDEYDVFPKLEIYSANMDLLNQFQIDCLIHYISMNGIDLYYDFNQELTSEIIRITHNRLSELKGIPKINKYDNLIYL